MMKIVLAALLALIAVYCDCELLSGSVSDKLNAYKDRVSQLRRFIARECPQLKGSNRLQKRDDLVSTKLDLDLEIEQSVYSELQNILINCRKTLSNGNAKSLPPTIKKTPATTSAPTTTTQPTTTQTTTTQMTTTQMTTTPTTTPTTTTQRVPNECLTAKNLTESWRLDHNGSDIRPGGPHSSDGYACDLHTDDTQWFRFTGAAGTRMLNTCPMEKSCGAYFPLWTDDVMPTAMGVATDIKVYAEFSGDCKWGSWQIQVMRCSEAAPQDFIYRQSGHTSRNCINAFCGMM